MLQTRGGKRTGRASVKIAVEMVKEGLITESEALMRVSPEHVEAFLHPMVDPAAKTDIVAVGLPASPGGATGKVVPIKLCRLAVKAEAGLIRRPSSWRTSCAP